jgi:hypothetical protein
MARTGLAAKGFVYLLLGILAFMAAFELGSQGNGAANRNGVFQMVRDWPAGQWLLIALALGLLCYSVWRFIEALSPHNEANRKAVKRVGYFFSGLIYLSVAITAFLLAIGEKQSGGSNQNQQLAASLLSKPAGAWLTGAAAFMLAAIGIYQLWYGFSEKYRKHVQGLSLHQQHANLLLASGKVGYMARGVVWLVVAYLLLQAALHHRASAAGDTGQAFQLVESLTYGSLMLGLIGLGFAAYGIFNFIRAKYENL